jgi:hypothetical protein
MRLARHIKGPAALALTGAIVAAILGTSAGAALRPQPDERAERPAPQLMMLSGPALAGAEARGLGWPAPEEALGAG